jgi:hypothetical protein
VRVPGKLLVARSRNFTIARASAGAIEERGGLGRLAAAAGSALALAGMAGQGHAATWLAPHAAASFMGPVNWVLMILGFGVLGGALRTRHATP